MSEAERDRLRRTMHPLDFLAMVKAERHDQDRAILMRATADNPGCPIMLIDFAGRPIMGLCSETRTGETVEVRA